MTGNFGLKNIALLTTTFLGRYYIWRYIC